MASSGSFKTSDYKGRYLVFSWQVASQSITDNKTVISWTLKSEGDSEWRYYKAGNFKVVIDGATVYQTSQDDRITISENTTIASGTYTFTHNTDGTRSFSASAQGGIYTYAVNCTGSGSFTLDTIPRTSKPTLSASAVELGKPLTIYTNRASSAFTHKLYYGWYTGVWNEIASNVGASYTWTPPLNFANDIPDATQGLGTIRCETYNGSTLIGTEEVRFTGTVPASMVPTCSIQVLDATSTKDTYGNLVKGLSKLYVKTTAAISYNSPIVAYTVQANGERYTAAEITTGVLTAAGTTTVQATVTDKRGRTSAAASASFPVLDYERPVISALTVHRCNADGSENDQGEYVQAVCSAAITALNNKNSAAYKLRYKVSTATSWTEVTLTALDGEYIVTDYAHIFEADSSSSYDVEIVATDDMGTVSRSTSASTAFTLMNWHPSGTGLAVGKVSERQNTMEIALDTEFAGNIIQRKNFYSAFSTGEEGSSGYVLVAEIDVVDAYADSPIVFTLTQRLAAAPMTIYISFCSEDNLTPSISSFTYEGEDYNAYLSPISSSAWGLYVKKRTAYDWISVQHWYTSGAMDYCIEVSFPGTFVSALPTQNIKAVPAKLIGLLDLIYPVGSIYMSMNSTSPETLFGGTWQQITNAFLLPSTTSRQTGGEETHVLTEAEIPAHTHWIYDNEADGQEYHHTWATTWKGINETVKGSAMPWSGGSGEAHNNMPPYITVYCWQRTA